MDIGGAGGMVMTAGWGVGGDGDEGGDGGAGGDEGGGDWEGDGSGAGNDEGVLVDMAPTEDAATGGGDAGDTGGGADGGVWRLGGEGGENEGGEVLKTIHQSSNSQKLDQNLDNSGVSSFVSGICCVGWKLSAYNTVKF